MPSCDTMPQLMEEYQQKRKNVFVPSLLYSHFGQDGRKKNLFTKISWIWISSQILRKFTYWENLLLFCMMLKRHLLIFRLWVIIFTEERFPRQTFTYSKSALEALKKLWNMLKVNNKDTRTILYCIYC